MSDGADGTSPGGENVRLMGCLLAVKIVMIRGGGGSLSPVKLVMVMRSLVPLKIVMGDALLVEIDGDGSGWPYDGDGVAVSCEDSDGVTLALENVMVKRFVDGDGNTPACGW